MRALVYGLKATMIEAIPALLSRAGFEVDLVTTARSLQNCRFVTRLTVAPDAHALVTLVNDRAVGGYDLVVAADDSTLRLIRRSALSPDEKVRLLPVSDARGLEHIGSKIGLSNVLAQHGVATPAYNTAAAAADLPGAAARLGYPVMVKADESGGGKYVFRCAEEADLAALPPDLPFPVLIQKEAVGRLVDCGGFFRNGNLVAFSFSTVIENSAGFGPSVVRSYRRRPDRDERLVSQMRQLGRALGADGFVNISAIQSPTDGQLTFFEADMRPNVWVEHAKYFGEDPADPIRAAYAPGQPTGAATHPLGPDGLDEVILPYLPRMTTLDILLNRHRCWSFYENYAGRRIWLERAGRMLPVRRIARRLMGLVGLRSAAANR